jgi:cytochrome b
VRARTEAAAATPTIRVWDRFVRLFHWSNAILVVAALLFTDRKWLHEDIGYVVAVLVALRIVWGLVGPGYARFSDFVAGPRAVGRYLRSVAAGRPRRYLGHNPLGGAMVVALLALLVVTCVSGWMSTTDRWFGVPWVDHLHHISGHLILVLAILHVGGVVLSSVLHRENLVLAMFTGRKPLRVGRRRAEIEHESGAAARASLDAD